MCAWRFLCTQIMWMIIDVLLVFEMIRPRCIFNRLLALSKHRVYLGIRKCWLLAFIVFFSITLESGMSNKSIIQFGLCKWSAALHRNLLSLSTLVQLCMIQGARVWLSPDGRIVHLLFIICCTTEYFIIYHTFGALIESNAISLLVFNSYIIFHIFTLIKVCCLNIEFKLAFCFLFSRPGSLVHGCIWSSCLVAVISDFFLWKFASSL